MTEHQAKSHAEVTTPKLAPGITFKVRLDELTAPPEVERPVEVMVGRYRGLHGHVHYIDHRNGLVGVRTGDPEEWTAWEARR